MQRAPAASLTWLSVLQLRGKEYYNENLVRYWMEVFQLVLHALSKTYIALLGRLWDMELRELWIDPEYHYFLCSRWSMQPEQEQTSIPTLSHSGLGLNMYGTCYRACLHLPSLKVDLYFYGSAIFIKFYMNKNSFTYTHMIKRQDTFRSHLFRIFLLCSSCQV